MEAARPVRQNKYSKQMVNSSSTGLAKPDRDVTETMDFGAAAMEGGAVRAGRSSPAAPAK
jgi:hypothetical protein